MRFNFNSIDYQKLKEVLFLSALYLFAIFPILPNALQSIAVILISTIGLLCINKFKKFTIIYIFGFTILLMWSWFLSENKIEYFERFKILVPLYLTIPLLISSHFFIDYKNLNRILYIYCFSLMIYIVMFFQFYFSGYELYESLDIEIYPVTKLPSKFKDLNLWDKIMFFYNEKYATFNSEYAYKKMGIKTELFRHPLYINVNILFAYIFSFRKLFFESKFATKFLNLLIISFLSVFIIFVHNESKYIVAICLYIIGLFVFIKSLKKFNYKLIFIASQFALICSIIYSYSHSLRHILIDFKRLEIYQNIIEKTDPKNFIFGIGMGDVQDFLIKILPTSLYSTDINRNYVYLNTHNQYIDILLSFGFFGLLFFLYYYLYLLRRYIKSTHNIEYSVYCIFVLIFLFVENLLNRSWGVYTILFVFIILFFSYKLKARTDK